MESHSKAVECEEFKAPSLEGDSDQLQKVYQPQRLNYFSVENVEKLLRNTGLFLQGHTSEVYSVVAPSDNNFIISGSSDNTVRIWNLKTRLQPAILEGHTDYITDVA